MARFEIGNFAAGMDLNAVSESDSDMRWIPVDDIRDNPRNFYPHPTNEALSDLMESIKANGLLEPPSVVAAGDHYRLISGHSRMEAIRLLRGQDRERWERVLCRVLPPMTEAQEDAAIIEANRQRKKDGALLQREAERLTEAYIKRKEAGEKLEGRIRDRVAEALGVKATKLANLNVIKKGLRVPGIIRAWEEHEIPEAAALEIARMDLNTQYRLLDWMIDHNRDYTIKEVRKFATIWSCVEHKCPRTAGLCPNAEAMYDAHYRNGSWYCTNCCLTCRLRIECSTACQYAKDKAPEPEPEAKAGKKALEDPRLDWRVMVPTFCGRVKALREKTGMDKKAFAESIGEYPGTYSAWENASLPGSERVPRLALALGVSTDYLYGLTDDPRPAQTQPDGQLVLAGWMPGGTTPTEPCWVAALIDMGEQELHRRCLWWDGTEFRFKPDGVDIRSIITAWLRLPYFEGGKANEL